MGSVGIIGGGPAGLALAYRLGRQGHAVTLFEAASGFGGLASSFRFGDIDVERYYHFICKGDDEYVRWLDELGLSGALRWSPTRLGFFYDGKLHSLSTPTDLLACDALTIRGRLRYALFAARCAAATDWRRLDGIPAKDWLIHHLGFETYHVMWHPLLDLKFHQFHDQISAAWIWHRIHRVARSRGRGMQQEKFGYLVGGTQTLVSTLVEKCRAAGARLHARAPVAELLYEGDRCTGLTTKDGVSHRFDTVVSTTPLPVFREVLRGAPPKYVEQLKRIDFIGVSCVLLRLRRSFSPYYWLNVNDPRVPFNGCIEYSHLNPGATPDGSSLLYVPYYVDPTSQRFRASDEETLDVTLDALSAIHPAFTRDWVQDAHVSRDRHAQVICRVGFGLTIPGHQTPVRGLYLIESSQLYPADRSISATLEQVTRVAARIGTA